MLVKILSDYEKGYLEAAIDAEGCIRLKPCGGTKRTYRPILYFANTNSQFLIEIKNIIGAGRIRMKDARPKHPKWRPLFELEVANANILRWLLPQLSLIIKEGQRKIVLEYLRLKRTWGQLSRREYIEKSNQLVQRIRELNRRGIPSSHQPLYTEGE